MLHPALLEHPSLAMLVRVTELTGRTVRYHLVVPVRVERPDSSRVQSVVIEDAQGPKALKGRIKVVAEGEVPAAMEGAVLHLTFDLIDIVWFADLNHRYPPLHWIYCILSLFSAAKKEVEDRE